MICRSQILSRIRQPSTFGETALMSISDTYPCRVQLRVSRMDQPDPLQSFPEAGSCLIHRIPPCRGIALSHGIPANISGNAQSFLGLNQLKMSMSIQI